MHNFLDNSVDVSELTSTPVNYFSNEACYQAAINSGRVKEGEVSVIMSPEPKMAVCNSVDGTLNYYSYNRFEYDKDGIQIENLKNTDDIYKAVYESLVQNNPDKRIDWDVLLKLNDNNYRLTVIQIETSQLEMEVK